MVAAFLAAVAAQLLALGLGRALDPDRPRPARPLASKAAKPARLRWHTITPEEFARLP